MATHIIMREAQGVNRIIYDIILATTIEKQGVRPTFFTFWLSMAPVQ